MKYKYGFLIRLQDIYGEVFVNCVPSVNCHFTSNSYDIK